MGIDDVAVSILKGFVVARAPRRWLTRFRCQFFLLDALKQLVLLFYDVIAVSDQSARINDLGFIVCIFIQKIGKILINDCRVNLRIFIAPL